MPAFLSAPAYDPVQADNIYATALLDGPMSFLLPESGEKSGLIDSAYSEYRDLCAAGVEVDPDAFCARFPEYQTSLRRLVEVHRELEANPNLLRSLDRWPAPGDRFHGFQLQQELGRGAFARVFLAREHAVGNRQVVVKVSLHADDEADTIGKLQHPNVVQIHSAPKDRETGFSIVCMPFLGGATLLSVIESLTRRKTLPARADFLLTAARDDRFPAESAAAPARALRNGTYMDGILYLGERLASALAYVHERGILHRDLKPSNVLLCPNGEPVLIDFNLAYDRSMTEHRLGGTLPYMPPEQLEVLNRKRTGDPVPADNRCDLYALGVLLYEISAGAHPFGPVPLKLKTTEARDFLLGRQRQSLRRLRSHNRSIDPALEALIARCLSHDPAGRPATARELAAEFRRLQAPIRRAKRWVVAHAKGVAVAGVLVCSGAAYGGVEIAQMPSAAAVHKQKADDFYSHGKFLDAIQEYAASLDANAEQPDAKIALSHAHQKLADALYQDGNYNAAVHYYTAALSYEKNDQVPALHYARGRAHLKLGIGNYQAAINDFVKANPKTNGRAAASIGFCLSMRGDYKGAANYYQTGVAAGFTSAAIHNNQSLGLFRSSDYAGAVDQATEALDLSPNLRPALYNRALARLALWHDSHDPSLAIDGLQDMREAVHLGADTKQSNYFAACLCAAVLHDRLGDQKSDPLYADGAAFLKKAAENGYSRKCLAVSPERLKLITEWAESLPQEMKITMRPTGMDDNLRLLDPVSD